MSAARISTSPLPIGRRQLPHVTRASSALQGLMLAAISTLPVTVHAQQDSSQSLETVVVTASAREQLLRDAPASISVLSREELLKSPVLDVADAVNQLEGVSIVGNTPNETDISIRGLSGEYTLLMVDGRRMNSRETMNRGTGGVQSNLLPPLGAIERIEVVRGPMSSLYGSDAIGGVINVITRKVTDRWIGSVDLSGVVQTDSALGDAQQGSFWFGGPLLDGRLGLQAYGKYQHRDEDDIYYPGPNSSGAHEFDSRGGGARLAFMPTDTQTFTVEAGYDQIAYQRTPGLSINTTALEQESEHRRRMWAVGHEADWGLASTRLSLQQEVVEKTERLGPLTDPSQPEVTNTVLDALLTIPLAGHTLKAGGQYREDSVTGIGGQDSIPGYSANVNKVTLNAWALFAEGDYRVTEDFTVTAGLRLDHDERYGSQWIPRLYGIWHLSDSLTLRGGVAKGFKAPTIRQSVPGYCMTTGGALLTPGSLCGNPDLDAETSVNSELGLGWSLANGGNLSLTLFNNKFENKVASYDTGVPDALVPIRNVYIYDNIDKVTLRGVELGATLPLADHWTLKGNYTYTDSKREGDRGEPAFDGSSLDGKPLDKTPEHMLNARVDWSVTDSIDLYARSATVGKQYWAGFRNAAMNTRERPGATTYDLGATWQATRHLRIGIAVLNLTDKVVPVDERNRNTGLSGNWMVDEGRRVWMSINAQL